MDAMTLDQLPGFRRRLRITPAPACVRSEVEDDFHRMAVTIHHQDGIATSIEPHMQRAPWSTCPGAVAQLRWTFEGVALKDFAERGEKRSNCTHLHDLATLAAAHARDAQPLTYDILVSDPSDGRRDTQLRRDGAIVLHWTLADRSLVQPAELAGMTLDKLGPWIAAQAPAVQEAARLLRWGTMIANGRAIPLAQQSDASRMPVGNCYTFQPDTRLRAERIVDIRDFSTGTLEPLGEKA